MPDSAVLDAPPPAPAAAPPAAPPPGTINVSSMPTAMPKGDPKPGSARERLRNELASKAKPPFGQAAPTPEPLKESPKPEAPKETQANEPPKTETDQKSVQQDAAAPEKVAQTKPGEEKKVSPWKLVESLKQERAKLEAQLIELRSQVTPEADRKSITERLESFEKRNRELEDEMRYVNYSKSQEYQDKYWKPYEAEWTRAMKDTSGIGVVQENGQARAFTSDDMLSIVQAPPALAARVAKDLVQDPDVATFLANRAEKIRDLFHAQSNALEEAKKSGAEREAKRKAEMQSHFGAMSKTVKQTWDQVNESVLADPKFGEYFKPREGDDEWNGTLQKGYDLVAQAYSENPMDPRLTPEQRLSVIRRHAAVRNMAAGWRPLKNENVKLKAKVAALENDLKAYRTSSPAAGGTTSGPTVPTALRGKAALFEGLRKLAK